MCWNFEVSLMSAITIYTVEVYIWLRNQNYDCRMSIILFIVGSIQWVETTLWKNLNN
jgi:hypothetical protein